MIGIVAALLLVPALYVFVSSSYLLLLTAAAVLGRPIVPADGPARRRFAVLVPAHDEHLSISETLRELRALDYPPERYDVHVIADNCSDDTAAQARTFGVSVHERVDPTARGKAYALQWSLDRLRDLGRQYDAFVVIDADCVVSRNFLRRMDARLEAGADVVQAYDSVRNVRQSPLAALRLAALAGYNYLRPLGRSALGLSAGLKGTGMCFAASVLEEVELGSASVAEDADLHLRLVLQGRRVEFAPEASVLSDMPVTYAQAESQNERWERGRLEILRRSVPALVREGIRRRSATCLDAAAEQLIPPLSVPFAIGAACGVIGAVVGAPIPATLAALGVSAQVIYLLSAMRLVRAPLRAYVSLVHAPIYIVWKLRLYLRSARATGERAWVRTPRLPR